MILAAAIGFAVEHFTSIEHAVLPAVLIGMFVATLIPAAGSCPVPGARPRSERPS